MSSIGGVSIGAGISNLKFQAEYSARVAKMQKDAVEQQGQMALQLLDAAGVGQNLNVTA